MSIGWMRDRAAKTADEAIRLMFEQGHKTVFLYNSCGKTLSAEISKFYDEIRRRNATIEDINQQTLPTNPYYWNDIDGCLAVQCAEIHGGTFEENADKLAMFSGWNHRVLSDTSARKPMSSKCLNSLAMMGYLAAQK